VIGLTRPKARAVVVYMAVSVSLSACSSSTSTPASALSAVAGSSTPTRVAAGATSSSPQSVGAPWCTRAHLALIGPLDGFGGATGEHELTFALRNTGSLDCSLEGFPSVELYDPRPMLFVYDNAHPGGPFLSMTPPSRVMLVAHGQGYFQVVKYRCDTGQSTLATLVRITMPNAAGSFTVDLSPPMTPVRSLWWCTGQTHDPGNVVSVSPIRQTARQLGP